MHACAPVLRLTVFNTRLSRGFLLGSLVEERIPVPQLLARVFLWKPQHPTIGENRLHKLQLQKQAADLC